MSEEALFFLGYGRSDGTVEMPQNAVVVNHTGLVRMDGVKITRLATRNDRFGTFFPVYHIVADRNAVLCVFGIKSAVKHHPTLFSAVEQNVLTAGEYAVPMVGSHFEHRIVFIAFPIMQTVRKGNSNLLMPAAGGGFLAVVV